MDVPCASSSAVEILYADFHQSCFFFSRGVLITAHCGLRFVLSAGFRILTTTRKILLSKMWFVTWCKLLVRNIKGDRQTAANRVAPKLVCFACSPIFDTTKYHANLSHNKIPTKSESQQNTTQSKSQLPINQVCESNKIPIKSETQQNTTQNWVNQNTNQIWDTTRYYASLRRDKNTNKIWVKQNTNQIWDTTKYQPNLSLASLRFCVVLRLPWHRYLWSWIRF